MDAAQADAPQARKAVNLVAPHLCRWGMCLFMISSLVHDTAYLRETLPRLSRLVKWTSGLINSPR